MFLRLTDNVLSFYETDILEDLRIDDFFPDEQELKDDYLFLAEHIDGNHLHVPDNAKERQRLASILVDLSNGLDRLVTSGESRDPVFDGRVSRSLSTLAWHVGRATGRGCE